MIRSTRTPRRRFWPVAVSALFVALGTAAPAQTQTAAPTEAPEGIDLVFVVDVSWSMYQKLTTQVEVVPAVPTGNDPQRLRWQAVQLSLDLLTDDDDVRVVPFNAAAPAHWPGNPAVRIPGVLPDGLTPNRSKPGDELREKVGGFIHDRNDRPAGPSEWNGDFGGTGVLSALDLARTVLLGGRRGRSKFIVLLTDGQESLESHKPAGLEHLSGPSYDTSTPAGLEKFNADPALHGWIDRYGRLGDEATVKVYTIGLGKAPFDGTFLQMIASKTGGHYKHAESNETLIQTFRSLLWQIKGCWTKYRPLSAQPGGPEIDLIGAVRDLDVLDYAVSVAEGTRKASAIVPGESPAFVWEGPEGAAPVKPGFQTTRGGYAFRHFDLRGAAPRSRLSTTWPASASGAARVLHFAKRTNRPLFRIVDPGIRPSYQSFELLKVRVGMDATLGFPAGDFVLEGTLDGRPLTFQFDHDRNEFQADVNLFEVSRQRGPGTYTLAVTARGKADPARPHALSDYRLELPPVDFGIENQLTLEGPGPVRLSNREPSRNRVYLQTRERFRLAPGAPRLVLEVRPTGSKPPRNARGDEVQVNWPTTIELKADPENDTQIEAVLQPSIGGHAGLGEYGGGEVVIGPPQGGPVRMAPLTVPYSVGIEQARLRLNQRPITTLDYAEGPEVTTGKLVWTVDERPLPSGTVVNVGLPNPPFGTDELKLRLYGRTEWSGQTLAVPAGEGFEIGFKPRANRDPGYFTVDLALAPALPGYEYTPEEGRVELRYKSPEIVVEGVKPLRLQPGRGQRVDLAVRLAGKAPVRRTIALRSTNPKTGQPDVPWFRRGAAEGPLLGLEAVVTLPPPEWTAAETGVPKPFSVRVSAPADAAAGTYSLVGCELSSLNVKPFPLKLEVIVDDLDVSDARGRAPTPLYFYQVRGRPLEQVLRVFARSGDRLDPAEVDVVNAQPFRNVSNHVENAGVRVKVLGKAPSDDARGVEVRLAFPDLGTDLERYAGTLQVRADRRELSRAIPCVVQQVELVKAVGSAR